MIEVASEHSIHRTAEDLNVTSSMPPVPIVDVLSTFSRNVMGVSETVLATLDGLLVASDTRRTHPESVAALAAATLGLGGRVAEHTGIGTLRRVVTQCSSGQLIALRVGATAVLAVMSDEGLDTAAFQREIPGLLKLLTAILDNAAG
ncbi:roadblock/LC7 domain-containing protein [Streptomyces sp. NBC_00424]|uniref:roadblock/LC7 domain-containing protein n=1 Tax=Streptomyces sp. NBC_00424 TaxID=2903648 RepID=UPI002256DD8F|nr:roadblock/LC7 domain-containing protein [Streptomyces sp. NBC_00424]MCX5078508.1 roadblock/LC7 domain-containing protein [Streptomyces sp. NBC_00424]